MSEKSGEILIVETSDSKSKRRGRRLQIRMLDRDAKILKAYTKRALDEALDMMRESA